MWSVGTLRSNSKWAYQITQEVFCKWTHQALSQFWSKCTHNVPEPLVESAFKEYLAIWSQCTQPYTQWVLWEFVVKLNHIESLLWVLWKEPTGHIMGIFLGVLWKNSQWVAQAHCGYILNKIVKEPIWVLSQNTCWVIWWVHFEFDHNVPTGHIGIKVVSKF